MRVMGLAGRWLASGWMALAIAVGCGSESDGPMATAAGTAGTAGKGGSGGGAGTGGGTAGSPVEAGSDTGAGGSKAEGGIATDAMDEWLDAAGDTAREGGVAPPTLSATGFFKSIGADGGLVLGDGVRLYEPRYKLWSDGADKTRWVYLPPNSKIDNTDQDHWVLPVGAKLWKEFALNGKRIETRLIHHVGPGPDDYLYATYWWKTN